MKKINADLAYNLKRLIEKVIDFDSDFDSIESFHEDPDDVINDIASGKAIAKLLYNVINDVAEKNHYIDNPFSCIIDDPSAAKAFYERVKNVLIDSFAELDGTFIIKNDTESMKELESIDLSKFYNIVLYKGQYIESSEGCGEVCGLIIYPPKGQNDSSEVTFISIESDPDAPELKGQFSLRIMSTCSRFGEGIANAGFQNIFDFVRIFENGTAIVISSDNALYDTVISVLVPADAEWSDAIKDAWQLSKYK